MDPDDWELGRRSSVVEVPRFSAEPEVFALPSSLPVAESRVAEPVLGVDSRSFVAEDSVLLEVVPRSPDGAWPAACPDEGRSVGEPALSAVPVLPVVVSVSDAPVDCRDRAAPPS